LLASSWLSAQSLPGASSPAEKPVVLSQAQYRQLLNLSEDYRQTAEQLRQELNEQKKINAEQKSTLDSLTPPLTDLIDSMPGLKVLLQKSAQEMSDQARAQAVTETALVISAGANAIQLAYILAHAFLGVP
jgi:DNA anti-recombination protein RmuC